MTPKPPSGDAVCSWIAADVAPYVDRWETERHYPSHLLPAFAASGLLQQCQSAGGRLESRLALADALGRTRSLGVAYAVLQQANLPWALLENHGSSDLKARYLGSLAAGELRGCTLVLTRPTGRTDGEVRASTDGKTVCLTGSSTPMVGATFGDLFVVILDARGETAGPLCVVIPSNAAGIRVEPVRLTGLRTAALAKVTFDRCVVPWSHLIMSNGQVAAGIAAARAEAQLVEIAALVALLEEVFQGTAIFAAAWVDGTAMLSDLQAVRHVLSDLAISVEVAKSLVAGVTPDVSDTTDEIPSSLGMARLYCRESAVSVVERCLQLFGGRGFMSANWVTRAYRDVVTAAAIDEGAGAIATRSPPASRVDRAGCRLGEFDIAPRLSGVHAGRADTVARGRRRVGARRSSAAIAVSGIWRGRPDGAGRPADVRRVGAGLLLLRRGGRGVDALHGHRPGVQPGRPVQHRLSLAASRRIGG